MNRGLCTGEAGGPTLLEQGFHARVAPEPAVQVEPALDPRPQGVVVREHRQGADARHPVERTESDVVRVIRRAASEKGVAREMSAQGRQGIAKLGQPRVAIRGEFLQGRAFQVLLTVLNRPPMIRETSVKPTGTLSLDTPL